MLESCTKEKIVTKEVEVAASTYSISGVVNYPDGVAAGAIVYLIGDVTDNTVAASDGTYSFGNLLPGSYQVYANYNTENSHAGRYDGITFLGTNVDVSIVDANISQDIDLTTLASSGVQVNTSSTGVWDFDTHHSEVVFTFPFDESNSEFSGRFDTYAIEIVLDDADLAGSSITASVDLLTVKTGQPGRDGYWTTESSVTGVDSLDGSGTKVNWFNGGCLNGYLGATTGSHFTTSITPEKQFATWTSTSIEHFGDGYLAHGLFTLNTGVDVPSDLYFKYLPGYIKGTAPAQTQMSSFEGKFTFNGKADCGVTSSHLGDADVDVYVSALVSKPL